ncbi:MAG: WD40 repeat domain-containing protein [Lewinella sp.]|uniref:WD40 repeat domain-containing protein n=1 Tax=Lewinella sp. TaxID=2004506 RepID=UPI003D6C5B64
MKYELSHDTIARQVFEKASTEARTRRKVERYISERYAAYQERGAQLTQDDVDFVWPHLDQVNSRTEELAFLHQGKRRLQRKRRIRLLLLALTSVAFAILALWANSQRDAVEAREQQSKSMRIGLAARYALYEGKPREAFRLAEQTLLWDNDDDATAIAREVLLEIKENPLVRSIHHKDTITTLQFSQDGTYFLSASLDGEVRLSNLDGKTLNRLQYDNGIRWARLLPAGNLVLSLSTTGKLMLWDVTGNKIQTLAKDLEFSSAELSTDNAQLGAITDKQVYVWDLRELAKPPLIVSLEAPVVSLGFLQIEKKWDLITADVNGDIKRWNAAGEAVLDYQNLLAKTVNGISVSPNNDKIVFRTAAGDFMLASNGDTLKTRAALLFRAYQPTHSAFTPSKQPERIVSISRDTNIIYVWNISSTQTYLDMQWSPKGKAQFGAMSNNGRFFLGASDDNETMVQQIVDSLLKQNEELFRFNNCTLWGVYAPNNVHFLSTAGGNQALLWKFDFDYVAEKEALNEAQVIQYYQTRLRPLTQEEQTYFRLK